MVIPLTSRVFTKPVNELQAWPDNSSIPMNLLPLGARSERGKALIALTVAHAVQCSCRIDAYTQAGLEKGSNLKEMTEAVHVPMAMRGEASLVHSLQMRIVAKKIFV